MASKKVTLSGTQAFEIAHYINRRLDPMELMAPWCMEVAEILGYNWDYITVDLQPDAIYLDLELAGRDPIPVGRFDYSDLTRHPKTVATFRQKVPVDNRKQEVLDGE